MVFAAFRECDIMATNIVLELLGAVYDGGMEPAKWVLALAKLREVLGVHSCAILAENRLDRQIACTANSGIKDKYLNRLQENYYSWLNHPIIASARPRDMREGQILLSNKLIEDTDLLRTPAYREFFAPQGIFYFCFVPLYIGEAARVNFILNWTKKHGPLRISDLRLFRTIIPHIIRSIQIQIHIQNAVDSRNALDSVIDDLSVGVIFLNRGFEVISLNRRARGFLDKMDGLSLDRGKRLVVECHESAINLKRLLIQAVNPSLKKGRNKTVKVPRKGADDAYTLLVLPLPREDVLPNLKTPVAVVFMGKAESIPVRLELQLSSLYSLTATEARLAKLLVLGKSLKESAEELQISMNTVRTHLKRIFNKTNTCRQGQLVSRLVRDVYNYTTTK